MQFLKWTGNSLATSALWLKRFLYLAVSLFVGFIVYDNLISDLLSNPINGVFNFLLLWALTAYIVLPRVHRFLTKVYVPDYFIGRVRTGDGLLGDPVNLAVIGTKKQLIQVMKKDGWEIADELSAKSSWAMVRSTIRNISYPTAPVSSLFLFGNKQDIAFQKEINNNPKARHHVRFWKTPAGWYLPGGHEADWVGAATFDRRVGFSLFTGQITHKIAENTDEERDFVGKSLAKSGKKEIIRHFSTAYHSKNGGGDAIKTDGSLVVVDLKS